MSGTPGGGGVHYRRSLASRVTLLTMFSVGIAVAVVALGCYVTVRVQLQSSGDETLLDRARQVQEAGTYLPLPAFMLGAADVQIAQIDLTRGGGTTADAFPVKLGAPEIAVARGQRADVVRTIPAASGSGEMYRVATVRGNDPGEAITMAQSLEPQRKLLNRLGLVSLLFGISGVLAAALAGFGVARNGLRPVRRLTDRVEEIARTEDLRPMDVEGDDEIARLAGAFNQMLATIEASRSRQRQLVADAGHELRTPLTSLRTNLDLLDQVSRQDARCDEDGRPAGPAIPPEARAELLDDVRAQIEELTTLIGDLVELAREDAPAHVVEEVDLADVVDRAVARVRRRAPDLAFEVATEPWWLTGENAALERAVTNLLDNAAKWSPDGGTVSVYLEHGTLVVDDQGPGIPDAELTRVFDRFYRAAESRTMPGSGLGLSIVRQVAERHLGWVRAGHAPGGGARMTFWVPGRATELVGVGAGPGSGGVGEDAARPRTVRTSWSPRSQVSRRRSGGRGPT